MLLHAMLVTFLIVVTKISDKSDLRRRGLFWLTVGGHSSHSGQGLATGARGSWVRCSHSQEADRDFGGAQLTSPFYSARDLSL